MIKTKLEHRVYLPSEVTFGAEDLTPRQEPRSVMMATPDYFDVVDVKNVHMEGNKGAIDKEKALAQWRQLLLIYQNLVTRGILEEVTEIPGQPGLEDMVFAANQTFPWIKQNEKIFIPGIMRHPNRQKEVPFFMEQFRALGYRLLSLESVEMFEGMGDTIPHYGKNLLYGGYGHRSTPAAYEQISQLLNVPVVLLELVDDRFYHLDTCFIPVDEQTAFITPVAFSAEGLKAIRNIFPHVIEIPEQEAAGFFALNAHCINDQKTGKRVAVLQQGTTVMKASLQAHGYEVMEIDTSEFMKSGGSVFCMKMMYY